MRQANYTPENHDKDFLLFSYLEGDLTEEQAKELDSMLAKDPDLQHELECWQDSRISAELYDTTALEQSMIRHEAITASTIQETSNRFYTLASIPVTVLIMVCINFCPLNHSAMLPVQFTVAQQTIEAYASTQYSTLENTGSDQSNMAVPVKPANISKANLQPAHIPVDISVMEYAEAKQVQPLAIAEPVSTALLQPVNQHYKVPKAKPTAPVLSRKQKRAIEKMKERVRNQRNADEFMKGNEPYVVPLNTKYF